MRGLSVDGLIGPGSAQESVRVRYSIKILVHIRYDLAGDMVRQMHEVIFDAAKERVHSSVPNAGQRDRGTYRKHLSADLSVGSRWILLRTSCQGCKKAAS